MLSQDKSAYSVALGARIVQRRKDVGIRQTHLARQIGLSRKTLWDYERGHSEPQAFTIVGLAEALSCSIDWLLTGVHRA